MSPDRIDAKVVVAKSEAIRSMLDGIDSLPLSSREEWSEDPRMIAAGESYLRRALEALLDLARHVLAKGFGRPVAEYAAIAEALEEEGLVPPDLAERLRKMARYRNRMVHFYDAISTEELYDVLTEHLDDVPSTLDTLRAWIAEHPDKLRGEI